MERSDELARAHALVLHRNRGYHVTPLDFIYFHTYDSSNDLLGTEMDKVIFQASDLAKDRTKFLDAARAGRALVRDKDGTGLVMLPEAELEVLEGYARWSQVHQRLTSFLASKREISVSELGDLAWLRVFDRDDIAMFAGELHDSLVAGLSDQDLSATAETVAAWRTTARQLEDPLRRSVLIGARDPSDFVDAAEPHE